MKTTRFILLSVLFLAAFLTACNQPGQKEEPAADTGYTNPVSTKALPDPSILKGDDGYFYLVATEEAVKGMPIAKSKDLVSWSQTGQVFPTVRPSLDGRNDGSLWAPSLNKIGSKYVLYYSYFSTQGELRWGIGAATADRPSGPWTDKGKVLVGGEVGVPCSIDPCFWSEGGKNYLIWGSYYGIWAIELTADGLSVKPDAQKVRLAGQDGYGLEGAMICKKNGKYYLFVSEGGTGYADQYKLGAARADQLLGPYYNKAGKDVLTAPVDFFLSAGNGFVSPGHCSEILTDDHGDDWVLCHAFVMNEEAKGRRLILNKLTWKDGWPGIEGGVCAKGGTMPYWK